MSYCVTDSLTSLEKIYVWSQKKGYRHGPRKWGATGPGLLEYICGVIHVFGF